jgi:hypothetical protein
MAIWYLWGEIIQKWNQIDSVVGKAVSAEVLLQLEQYRRSTGFASTGAHHDFLFPAEWNTFVHTDARLGSVFSRG